MRDTVACIMAASACDGKSRCVSACRHDRLLSLPEQFAGFDLGLGAGDADVLQEARV